MNYARIIDGLAVDVCATPSEMFQEEVAAQFVVVPDNVAQGWRNVGGTWQAPPAPTPPSPPMRLLLSRVEFKLQFTSAERLAIRAARDYSGTDAASNQKKAVLDDFYDIVEDPGLTAVDLLHPATIEGVGALALMGLIEDDRVAAILAGLPE